MIDKYEEADLLGRNIVLSIFKDKVHLTQSQISDCWDLSGSTINGDFYIEVKYRPEIKSTKYDTDLLEYSKMSALRNIDRNAKHYYFMLFSDNVGRLYNLKDVSIMDVYIHSDPYPISSTENKGEKDKLMLDLMNNKAKTYKW